MTEVHVVTSSERKRHYSEEEKRQVLTEAARFSPAATARKHHISRSLIYLWKKQIAKSSPFVPVAVKTSAKPIRLNIGHDLSLELPSDVEPKLLACLLNELRKQ